MTFLYLKAVHIVFVVTWFAGMFYIPRLFIYVTEAYAKPEPERTILLKQLLLMTRRLWYGITWPSAIITLLMGATLLFENPGWLSQGYMHVKLLLVAMLYAYHFSLQHIFNQLKRGVTKYSSTRLRIWNEVATLFLISIVFIIVLKDSLSMLWGIGGLLVLAVILLIAIRIYRKIRNE